MDMKISFALADLRNYDDIGGAPVVAITGAIDRLLTAQRTGDMSYIKEIWSKGWYAQIKNVKETGHVERHRQDVLRSLDALKPTSRWAWIWLGAAGIIGTILFTR